MQNLGQSDPKNCAFLTQHLLQICAEKYSPNCTILFPKTHNFPASRHPLCAQARSCAARHQITPHVKDGSTPLFTVSCWFVSITCPLPQYLQPGYTIA